MFFFYEYILLYIMSMTSNTSFFMVVLIEVFRRVGVNMYVAYLIY